MKRLNHNARVLVTDGGRATVFRNAGDVGDDLLEQLAHLAGQVGRHHVEPEVALGRGVAGVGRE